MYLAYISNDRLQSIKCSGSECEKGMEKEAEEIGSSQFPLNRETFLKQGKERVRGYLEDS